MNVHEMLDLIQEDNGVVIWFSSGIKGHAGDLTAVLNDEMLSETVSYIDSDTLGVINIHIK